jgi:hypothetical protein
VAIGGNEEISHETADGRLLRETFLLDMTVLAVPWV